MFLYCDLYLQKEQKEERSGRMGRMEGQKEGKKGEEQVLKLSTLRCYFFHGK